jgi:hypothetical protein
MVLLPSEQVVVAMKMRGFINPTQDAAVEESHLILVFRGSYVRGRQLRIVFVPIKFIIFKVI